MNINKTRIKTTQIGMQTSTKVIIQIERIITQYLMDLHQSLEERSPSLKFQIRILMLIVLMP